MAPITLNPAQQSVADHGLLQSGFSVVLQMPTGSGKTWLARQAIEESLKRGLRAVYLSPLRALADELAGRWQDELDQVPVGVFTGGRNDEDDAIDRARDDDDANAPSVSVARTSDE